MASLKEIRNRINSITSTRKITSAMKMVSASKLKKAQNALENSLPYLTVLANVINDFKESVEDEIQSSLMTKREVKKVALIAVSSNSSLCGAFNNNVIKKFTEVYETKSQLVGKENIQIYAVGKKIEEYLNKINLKTEELPSFIDLNAPKLDYEDVKNLSEKLLIDFSKGEIDELVFIYNHMKNAAVQEIYTKRILPFSIEKPTTQEESAKEIVDYIVEPSKKELIEELIPKVVNLQVYTGFLDSLAAEHGARTTAMQIATDNADDLLQELRLTYNKLRQAAITTEIITITGGAEAIK